MNPYDFVVYQNAQNEVSFIIRDVDRKPINLLSKKLYCTLNNPYNNSTILQRGLNIEDPVNGRAVLTLFPSDTNKFEPGDYTYSVLMINPNSKQDLLYVNQNSLAVGNFQVLSGALPNPSKAYEVSPRDWTPWNPQFNNTDYTHWRSSAYPGNLQLSSSNPLHTIAIYPHRFHGLIYIQGSLEITPDIEEGWFPINIRADKSAVYFDGKQSRVEAHNFYLNLQWVRFVYFDETPWYPVGTKLPHPPYRHPPEKILYKANGYGEPKPPVPPTPREIRELDYIQLPIPPSTLN